MNRQEIQKIVLEAFELGCAVGSSSWEMDRSSSLKQEQEIANRIDKLVSKFESSTGFSLGKPCVEQTVIADTIDLRSLPVICEDTVVVKKKSRYSRRL